MQYIRIVFSALFHLLLQGVLLKNAVLFQTAFCFPYISFLLLLPLGINNILLCFIGFVYGLGLDLFYDTLGVHAMACVLLAYLRSHVLNLVISMNDFEPSVVPSKQNIGSQAFVIYSGILIFAHHTLFFFIESSGFGFMWQTIGKVLFGSLFTFGFVLFIQQVLYTTYRRQRR